MHALLDSVLAGLGLGAAPRPDLDGLRLVYDAWCRSVPFDNSRKLVHVAAGDDGPLPGDEPREFLEAWLRWGTGGTCWAANGALCEVLAALGFDAVRGVGTMLVAPDLPPNHGTVAVRSEGRLWLVDASMLHGEPLLLDDATPTGVAHPSRGVRCGKRADRWHVRWRPLHMPDGLDCRIDHLGATPAEFRERHDATRGWSPFNYQLHVRRVLGDRVVGLAFGQRVEIDAEGRMTSAAVDDAGRRRILVEELGFDPAFVSALPADRPTPPPPWSSSAGS